jgi:hypothetical protein
MFFFVLSGCYIQLSDKTRGDEAPRPAFSALATLKKGDVFTVSGRRGGSYGFMLIANDCLWKPDCLSRNG